jgi:hypothetical protein
VLICRDVLLFLTSKNNPFFPTFLQDARRTPMLTGIPSAPLSTRPSSIGEYRCVGTTGGSMSFGGSSAVRSFYVCHRAPEQSMLLRRLTPTDVALTLTCLLHKTQNDLLLVIGELTGDLFPHLSQKDSVPAGLAPDVQPVYGASHAWIDQGILRVQPPGMTVRYETRNAPGSDLQLADACTCVTLELVQRNLREFYAKAGEGLRDVIK